MSLYPAGATVSIESLERRLAATGLQPGEFPWLWTRDTLALLRAQAAEIECLKARQDELHREQANPEHAQQTFEH